MKKKILVIEDEASLREEIVDMLTFENFEVFGAENGFVGLELAREHKPDLIISDIMMPGLDGYGLLSELRRQPETQLIPFIFLTARADRPSQRKGMVVGADDYLTKPFTFDELLVAVRVRLERQAIILSDVSRRIEELDLLRQVDQELSYRMSPEWAITIMMDWALRRTGARTAIMGTVQPDGEHLRLEYVSTYQTDSPPQKGDIWSLDGVIGELVRYETPIFIDDIRQNTSVKPIDPETVSLLGLPLTTADHVLGVLLLESDKPRAFTDDDQNFLAQMANRTAVVLEHAKLFQRLTEQQEQELELREMFGRFVSKNVADAIRTGEIQLKGESRVISVLFCDIRDFTAFSERHTPERVVAMLNEYLSLVVDAAQANGGTVNKFGGDSTLIIYGAPAHLEENAYHALLSALKLRSSLEALNEQRTQRQESPIRMGIGINTGEAVAGAVGTEDRQEYTVIGDTVNLASRIQMLNKDYPAYDILISNYTYEALGQRKSEFAFVDLGELPIRGKLEPVKIWAVTGFTEVNKDSS